MNARSVRLPAVLSDRLDARAQALLALGDLLEDDHAAGPGEREALSELTERLRNTYPYPDPRYAGQMLKPPAVIAWAAYATAMLLNPNNHALDGGPATAEMEKEAVAQLAAMFGLPRHLGHLTSSGTIANLEALWVARELHPDGAIVFGANAHYTHARVCAVLGARHDTVPEDARGRIDLDALEARLRSGGVGTVVVTPGTTALGAVDDVAVVAGLCADHGARLHVDAAYGGFFRLLADGGVPGVATDPFAAIARADSVVVDPHKHGLQPYGCGCVLFADPGVGTLYAHDSPYTYFTSGELHLGEISLECSRAGASAAALWTTLRALPPTRGGLGRHLAGARTAALDLCAALQDDERMALVVDPELDIVCMLPAGASASQASAAAIRAFDTLAQSGWHVAKLRVDTGWLRRGHPEIEADAPATTVLRCCLLKQDHAEIAAELAGALAGHLTAAR
ncbi:MAG TPA: aminotransferase class V-fold PLP-dependent enzyme [Solirubrobacteraceae bacterium]|nr:aminotransferase class V-fold PLP-dependent enzyme [Solirubrobacteraceae bacterium]